MSISLESFFLFRSVGGDDELEVDNIIFWMLPRRVNLVAILILIFPLLEKALKDGRNDSAMIRLQLNHNIMPIQ